MTCTRLALAVLVTALTAAAQTPAKGKTAPATGKAAPATGKAAVPPKPGLASCAGKIEGRYAESLQGQIQMEFRSGKTTMKMFGETETLDCWITGKKIYLYMKDEPEPMELDVNNDGSLQAPMGEFKKKGD